jgi:flavin reductase
MVQVFPTFSMAPAHDNARQAGCMELATGSKRRAGRHRGGNMDTAKPQREMRDLYREVMARVAGGVHVVTTSGASGRAGVTATAVVSVSDDPPTLLACINGASRLLPLVDAHRRFAISVLSAGDGEVSDTFAGRSGVFGEDRFKHGSWADGPAGQPMLQTALARLECRLLVSLSVATHRVLVGEVLAGGLGDARQALIYFGRSYHAL